MKQTAGIAVEHVVVASYQPYEKVLDGLQALLGSEKDWEAIRQQLSAGNFSLEGATRIIEQHLGASGFVLFSKVEQSLLLSLVGRNSRAVQYAVGNPLLAIQMTAHMPEAALYAPLRIVVYEDEEGKTFVAYDNFVSLLAQYQRDEITQVARIVESKLEALIEQVTAESAAR